MATIEVQNTRELTHVCALVTDAGDTAVYTPTPGKRVRLRWIYTVGNPASATPPLIKVRLGATDVFWTYGVSKAQTKTGAPDEALVVNLSGAGEVAVTAFIEELEDPLI